MGPADDPTPCRDLRCDVCLGNDFEPYLEPGPCGRALYRCQGCGLVVAAPRTPQTRAQAQGGRARRDRRSDLRRAATVMKLLPEGRVLDVGCGGGLFLTALDPARYETVGTERDARLAGEAQRRFAETHLRGAVLHASLCEAALPGESFDLVALFGSLDGAVSPRATCMEASRLLKPGGYAIIETPSLTSLTALLCGTRWAPLRDPRADYFFTPATLERLMSICGLTAGAARLPVPAGWPPPGTLVYVARKSSVTQRASSLSELAGGVGKIAPMGAAQ